MSTITPELQPAEFVQRRYPDPESLPSPNIDVRIDGLVPVRLRGWKFAFGVLALANIGSLEPDVLYERLAFSGGELPDHVTRSWQLTRGLPRRSPSGDAFGEWNEDVYETYREMLREAIVGEPLSPHEWTPEQRESLRTVALAVRRAAHELAIHMADLCHPVLRRAALRLHPTARLFAYTEFAGDPTGRIFRLAETHPGLLLMAYGAWESDYETIATTILTGAVEGRSPDRIAGAAVDVWARETQDPENWSILDMLDVRLADYFDAMTPAESRRVRNDQARLLLLARGAVPPRFLMLPPPLAFRAEDVPTGVLENARWFRVMKSSKLLSHKGEPDETALRTQLASLVSRQGVRAFAGVRHSDPIRTRLEEVHALLRESRTSVDRHGDLRQLIDEARLWRRGKLTASQFAERTAARMQPRPTLCPSRPVVRVRPSVRVEHHPLVPARTVRPSSPSVRVSRPST